jgi:hypothetical protein
MTRADITRLNAQISTGPHPRRQTEIFFKRPPPPIRKDSRRAPRNPQTKQSKEETAPGFVFEDLADNETTREPEPRPSGSDRRIDAMNPFVRMLTHDGSNSAIVGR